MMRYRHSMRVCEDEAPFGPEMSCRKRGGLVGRADAERELMALAGAERAFELIFGTGGQE